MSNFYAVWRSMGSLETFVRGPYSNVVTALRGGKSFLSDYDCPDAAPGSLTVVEGYEEANVWASHLQEIANVPLELLLIAEEEIEEATRRH